jgi:hypothetical protein
MSSSFFTTYGCYIGRTGCHKTEEKLSSAVLAMMEHHCKLRAYHGRKCDQEWGGILVGDDYQLPSVDSGAIHIFDSSTKKSSITVAGESIFSEFAENVMKLDDSK